MKTDSEIMTVQTSPHPRYTSFCSHCVCYQTLNYCQGRTKTHRNTTHAYLHIHDEYVPEIIAKGPRTLAVLGLQSALRNFFYTNIDNQSHKLRANRHPRENSVLQNLTEQKQCKGISQTKWKKDQGTEKSFSCSSSLFTGHIKLLWYLQLSNNLIYCPCLYVSLQATKLVVILLVIFRSFGQFTINNVYLPTGSFNPLAPEFPFKF